ncbi:MAG: aminotransferase class I/II-fold pyridoxal phosphate-dependent enzyme [Spirochaetaceae bacterium]|nr:MAG: aminotransferase class I/II-fold pyridoxal phosphate-dependent enzyme [Spirochaetaceae bacterium]
MNPLASQLNTVLDTTVAGRLLSGLGRRMYFPKGIVAQTSEANARAHRFNATVGMAVSDGEPMVLSGLQRLTSGLTPTETVAYAPTPGVPELRSLWKQEMLRKNPSLSGVPTSNPMVTGGLTNGLFHIGELFLDDGDAFVLPDLFWGNYRLMAEVRIGAQVVTFPLFDPAGGFNVDGLSDALAGRTKAIVLLNFPNNPTGYSPTVSEADRIVSALAERAAGGCDILVVCDDAYFGLLYEENLLEESLFARLAGAHDRILAVKVDGATKEDFAWGFRIGFVTFAGAGLATEHLDALERKLMGNIRASVSNSSRIAQSMLIHALKSDTYHDEKASAREVLKSRYEAVRRILQRIDLGPLSPLPFNSGYFMAFACDGIDAERLRTSLLDQGIGTIAIGSEYLRVAFSTIDESDLEALFDAIAATARSLAP